MRAKNIKRVLIGLVVLVNLLLWLIPSNVAKLIARDRHILMGRYSVERLTLIIVLIPLSLMAIYLLAAARENFKQRCLRIVLLLTILLSGLPAVDFIARFVWVPRYISTQKVYHRIPGKGYQVTVRDIPEAANSYRNIPPGYPPLQCKLSIDARGFRNQQALTKCDILVLGDSFAEGSHVSDEQCWPTLLAKKSKLQVYNLGMSGTDLLDYLRTYQTIGKNIASRIVICMIYEGNDFRITAIPDLGEVESPNKNAPVASPAKAPPPAKKDNFAGKAKAPAQKAAPVPKQNRMHLLEQQDTSFADRFRAYYKTSPLVIIFKNAFIKYLAPINAIDYSTRMPSLSWLPIAVGTGAKVSYYSFPPKRVHTLYLSRDDFLKTPSYHACTSVLSHLHQLCRADNRRLLVVYAPTKTRVVLPLVKQRLSAPKLHDFVALRKSHIPEAEVFFAGLFRYLDGQEQALADLCKQQGIEFVSLIQPLRESAALGTQVYFTYDQHWTPPGHQIVADIISRFCRKK